MSDYLRGMEDALIYLRKHACKKCVQVIDAKLTQLSEQRADWVSVNIFEDKKLPAP